MIDDCFSKLFPGAYWCNIYPSPTAAMETDPGSQSSVIGDRLRDPVPAWGASAYGGVPYGRMLGQHGILYKYP